MVRKQSTVCGVFWWGKAPYWQRIEREASVAVAQERESSQRLLCSLAQRLNPAWGQVFPSIWTHPGTRTLFPLGRTFWASRSGFHNNSRPALFSFWWLPLSNSLMITFHKISQRPMHHEGFHTSLPSAENSVQTVFVYTRIPHWRQPLHLEKCQCGLKSTLRELLTLSYMWIIMIRINMKIYKMAKFIHYCNFMCKYVVSWINCLQDKTWTHSLVP